MCDAITSGSCSGVQPAPDASAAGHRAAAELASAVDERGCSWGETVGLKERLKHRPSELSGAQQRVAIREALVAKPELVFADEPTGNLDSRTGAEILTFLRYAVDAYAQTIVMVTHDPVAAGYADQVVFLADGRIVGSLDRPTPDRVLDAMRAL